MRTSLPLAPRAPALPDIELPADMQAKLGRLFADVAQRVPGFPRHIVENEGSTAQRFISRETFAGQTYSFVVFGLDDPAKERAISLIKAGVAAAGIPLNVLDGGGVISMSHRDAHKGLAVRNFAARVGVRPEEVVKFGDKAGPTGNDRQLLVDANSYNVGEDEGLPGVVKVGKLAAAGVLSVIADLEKAGKRIRAIASDFDGTLTGDGEGELADRQLCIKLKELLEQGTQIAVITGRGQSIFDVLVRPLRELGADDAALENLTVYMYNGGRALVADQAPERQRPKNTRRW